MAKMSDSERTLWTLAEQVRVLTERLAEVEAERDRYDKCWVNAYHRALEHRARAEAAEARLAEVEAERDALLDRENDLIFEMKDARNCYALHMKTCRDWERHEERN